MVKDVYGSTLKIIEEMEMRMVVEWWQEAGRDGLQMEESGKVMRDTKRVKKTKNCLLFQNFVMICNDHLEQFSPLIYLFKICPKKLAVQEKNHKDKFL